MSSGNHVDSIMTRCKTLYRFLFSVVRRSCDKRQYHAIIGTLNNQWSSLLKWSKIVNFEVRQWRFVLCMKIIFFENIVYNVHDRWTNFNENSNRVNVGCQRECVIILLLSMFLLNLFNIIKIKQTKLYP